MKEGITINPPASIQSMEAFQIRLGFKLPEDFVNFYSICNGFDCEADMFTIKKLEEVMDCKMDYGNNWFHFSNYLLSCDSWSLRIFENHYEIFNLAEAEIVLTSSLNEFLERYLKGDIFDAGGLYEWHEEMKSK